MRILYLASAFLPESRGGTELHAYYLAREMRDLGHEVLIITRGGDGDNADYDCDRYEVDGLPVFRINYNFSDAASFEWIYKNPHIDSIFAQELARFQPDLVHVHHLTCLSTSIIDVARDRGITTVMTLHDFWMVCPRGQRIDTNLEICATIDRAKCTSCLADLWPHFFPGVSTNIKAPSPEVSPDILSWDAHIKRVLERCNLLLTPSEFHREKMLEFDFQADRLEALPHGLDHDLLAGFKEPTAKLKNIAFIGSVIPSKGVHLLVEAFSQLNTRDLDIQLEIYGEAPSFHGDAEYLTRMRAGLSETQSERVQFQGAYDQRDLPKILAGVDVLVVPSLWWESFCLTVREGLLAGCVVVAANHGPMIEALANGQDGLLFEPGDAGDLARQLQRLVDDPKLLSRYRNRGGGVKDIQRNAQDMLTCYSRAFEHAGHDPLAPFAGELVARVASREDPEEHEFDVTVFIPTYNGGALFEEVLQQIFAQEVDFSFEVLVIDSGSKDQTLEIVSRYPVRLIEIPNNEFNHGLTRNRAVREAKAEIVALLTQDAVPYDKHWLATLVKNFDDPEVAGAYCHQLPRADCNPFQKDRLENWTKGEGGVQVKCIQSRSEYEAMNPWEKYRTIAFDDVASCVRKSVMKKIPYEKRQFGEDVAWGRQAILAGYKLVMDPNAVVVHSHNNSIWYEFKRVYLDHQNLNDLVGMHLVRRFVEVFRFTLDGTRHLGGVIKRSDISLIEKLGWWCKVPFYSLGQNMGQYLGARTNAEGRRGIWGRIDRFLRKGV